VGSVGDPAPGVRVALAADGEILLQAPQLLRAYCRGVPAAFDAEGWFHTGDLAERDADGGYRVVGRSSELIISGGENLHPNEIEEIVASWPEVAECAVVGLPDTRWGEVPVLAWVGREGAVLDEAAVAARLQGRLARFKWPRRVLRLDSLPRTPLGKVQRGELVRRLLGPAD
jgi:fatty-acyl-CoA synthase